jgi:1-deoxy-D-xylulose-5-phosphate reductoisomerase
MDISKNIIKAYEKFPALPKSVEDIFMIDAEVRRYTRSLV